MTNRKNRTGIFVVVLFTLGAAAWSYVSTPSGETAQAGLLGSGIGGVTGQVASTAGGTPEGFTGSDEELKTVVRPRPGPRVATTAGGTPDGLR